IRFRRRRAAGAVLGGPTHVRNAAHAGPAARLLHSGHGRGATRRSAQRSLLLFAVRARSVSARRPASHRRRSALAKSRRSSSHARRRRTLGTHAPGAALCRTSEIRTGRSKQPREGRLPCGGRPMMQSLIVNDVTGLNPVAVWAINKPTSVNEVVEAIRRFDGPVSVGGGRFSMGGQTASPGSLHLDMLAMNRVITFSPIDKTIRV